jgi:circadian clock protein KaiB
VSLMKRKVIFKFRLYIAADTQNSVQAASNLIAFCNEHLADRYEIEYVDVFKHPNRALQESIRMTPTLVKLSPAPVRRIVGTLADTRRVMETLDL